MPGVPFVRGIHLHSRAIDVVLVGADTAEDHVVPRVGRLRVRSQFPRARAAPAGTSTSIAKPEKSACPIVIVVNK